MIKYKEGKVVKSQNKLSKLMKREKKDKKDREEPKRHVGMVDTYNLNGSRGPEKAERRMEQKQCLKRWCLRISKIGKRHLAKIWKNYEPQQDKCKGCYI